jgi:hypothetical protein
MQVWRDYAKIIGILGDEISEEESLKIRTAARQRAGELILANRANVERLARRLIENERVNPQNFWSLWATQGNPSRERRA